MCVSVLILRGQSALGSWMSPHQLVAFVNQGRISEPRMEAIDHNESSSSVGLSETPWSTAVSDSQRGLTAFDWRSLRPPRFHGAHQMLVGLINYI